MTEVSECHRVLPENRTAAYTYIYFWFCVFLFTTSLSGLTLWKRFREIWDSNLAVCTYQVELGKSTDDLLARIMTRALILFNLLFLLQNVLDIEYLWSGAALPAGMSYAEYAHRGAYPLILTALLAGLLTLIAFRRQSTGAGWKWARILVYVWLLQNVFLVASSLLRLGKYIAVYSLTELRVAAGLWMLLVACGLCLILWKIWKNRSLNWLVWTNGAALLVLLLFVMLCDIRGHIAEYNLAHCREAVSGHERRPAAGSAGRPLPLFAGISRASGASEGGGKRNRNPADRIRRGPDSGAVSPARQRSQPMAHLYASPVSCSEESGTALHKSRQMTAPGPQSGRRRLRKADPTNP